METSSNNQTITNSRAMLRRSFFKLYHSINAFGLRSNTDIRGDLTYRDIMYLNIIMFTDDCTVTKLVELLNITKPAVTVKVNNLVERGLVIKRKSPTDYRVNILTASPAAYAAYSKDDEHINSALEKMLDEYSPEDIEKFSEMVATLTWDMTHIRSDSDR